MIGWLKGSILDKSIPGKIVVDVQGVGYDVDVSLPTFFRLESEAGQVGLHIHTLVREDALILFGFIDLEERSLFRALIKVNGVGPKSAIAILSSITPAAFVQCIHAQDTAMLTKLPGIGKKTAERLVVEMKDSLVQQMASMPQYSIDKAATKLEHLEAIRALEALGYKEFEASKVIKKIDDGHKSCEQLIRQALQILAN